MKALIISKVNESQSGGIEAQQKLLAQQLEKRNFDVLIVTPHTYQNTLWSKFSRLIGTFALNRKVIFEKYDLILVNDPQLTLPAILSALKSGKKVLFSHGWIFHNRKPKIITIIFTFILRLLSKRYTLISCTSSNDAQLIFDRPNVAVMGNPVRLAKPTYQIKLPKSIVVISRDAPNKNIPLMNKLLLNLLNDGYLENATIVGTAAANITDHPRISKCPRASQLDLDNIYKSSQYFLSLSKYEGFGLALIEAISYGCIPIVSNIEAYQEHSTVINSFIDLNATYEDNYQSILKILSSDYNPELYQKYVSQYNPDKFVATLLQRLTLLENTP
ncbi:glycosyltransferase [Planktomarina temperata]|nr:glycosyltransferase [Planktomarina temperata]